MPDYMDRLLELGSSARRKLAPIAELNQDIGGGILRTVTGPTVGDALGIPGRGAFEQIPDAGAQTIPDPELSISGGRTEQWNAASPAAAPAPAYGTASTSQWSKSRTKGIDLSPEVMGAPKEAARLRDQAAQAGMQAGQALSRERLAAYGATQAERDEQIGKLQAQREKQRAEVVQKQAEYEKAFADAKSEKIDPDRWWSDKAVPAKIAMGLATAMGGFLEGFSHGQIKNSMRGVIQSAIDRDIRTQQMEAQRRGQGRQEMRGMLHMLQSRIGDTDAQIAQTRVALSQGLMEKLAMAAERAQEPALKARMLTALSASQEAFAQNKARLEEMVQDRVVQQSGGTSQRVPLASAGAGGNGKAAVADLPTNLQSQVDAADAALAKMSDYNDAVLEKGRYWGSAGKVGAALVPGVEADATAIEDTYRPAIGGLMAQAMGSSAAEVQKKYEKSLWGFGQDQSSYLKRVNSLTAQAIRPVEAMLRTAEAEGNAGRAKVLRTRLDQMRQRRAEMQRKIKAD